MLAVGFLLGLIFVVQILVRILYIMIDEKHPVITEATVGIILLDLISFSLGLIWIIRIA